MDTVNDGEFNDSSSRSSSPSSSQSSSSPSFIDREELQHSNPDYAELFEDTCVMMDDYILDNLAKVSSPDFHDDMSAYLFEQLRITLFASVGETHAIDSTRAHSLICVILEQCADYYFDELAAHESDRFIPRRSSSSVLDGGAAFERNVATSAKVSALIQQQNQTEQRTDAWYARRHSMITASSLWKVFGTDSVKNQLIYEKCKPYVSPSSGDDKTQQPFVNVDSPLHWGQKYEFLSAEIYQRKNNTRLGEFGCIQHSDPRFPFIGGSPDGINVDESSPLFGRMVEIKNIVNREITGIPKEEYWIQMQIQMEVCDLDACDFVETRFVEYDDPQDYYTDVQIDYAYSQSRANANGVDVDTDEDVRGIILYFINHDTRKPHYEYMPFDYLDVDTQEAWILNTISRFDTPNYIWIRNIYWRLDQYSCVLVRRNKLWFNSYAAPQIETVWRTIERERVGDYSHRAPKKRIVATNENSAGGSGNTGKGLVNFGNHCNIVI